MFTDNEERGFFEDLAVAFKECCKKHDIDLEEAACEFDDFLDELDKDVTHFLDDIGKSFNKAFNKDENDIRP